MASFKIIYLTPLFVFFLISSCAIMQHGDDENYTLCKKLEGEIQFGGNTSYTREAEGADVEKRRLQATYDKLNCSQYQWFKF